MRRRMFGSQELLRRLRLLWEVTATGTPHEE